MQYKCFRLAGWKVFKAIQSCLVTYSLSISWISDSWMSEGCSSLLSGSYGAGAMVNTDKNMYWVDDLNWQVFMLPWARILHKTACVCLILYWRNWFDMFCSWSYWSQDITVSSNRQFSFISNVIFHLYIHEYLPLLHGAALSEDMPYSMVSLMLLLLVIEQRCGRKFNAVYVLHFHFLIHLNDAIPSRSLSHTQTHKHTQRYIYKQTPAFFSA